MRLIYSILLFLGLCSSLLANVNTQLAKDWYFLNTDQQGQYDFKLRHDVENLKIKKYNITAEYGISGVYDEEQNIPNIVVEDNYLYTLDTNNRIVVFDLEKNKVVKRHKVKIKGISGAYPSGIALYNDYIYATFDDGTVFAYSLITNNILWSIKLHTPINSAPVVEDNKIFFVSNNIIYALDVLSGNVLWNINGSKSGVSLKKLYVPTLYKGYLMVGLSSSDFFIISSETGTVISRQNLNGLYLLEGMNTNPLLGDIKASPLIIDNKVFLTSNSKAVLLSLIDNKVIWQSNTFNSNSSAVFNKNTIIIIDTIGNLIGMDVQSGKEKWRENLLARVDSKKKVFWNNVQVINDIIVVTNSIGDVFLVSLEDHAVLTQFKVYKKGSERLFYSPIITQYGILFYTNRGNLYIAK